MDLAHRFDYHPPKDDETRMAHEDVRYACLELAAEVKRLTGPKPSREQSLAITAIEEAMFWANAAIARGSGRAE